MKHLCYFSQIARAVWADQVQFPITCTLSADLSCAEANARLVAQASSEGLSDASVLVAIVTRGDNAVGWWSTGGLLPFDGVRPISEAMEPIDASQILESDCDFLALLRAWSERPDAFFFIKDRAAITGTIHYECLTSHPLAVVCFFALVSELEDAALTLCRHFASECWSSLSDRRQADAIRQWHKRREQKNGRTQDRIPNMGTPRVPLAHESISCTSFGDKGDMMRSCKLLIDWKDHELRRLWESAERLRNACAHSVGDDTIDLVLPREQLGKLLGDWDRLMESMQTVTPRV